MGPFRASCCKCAAACCCTAPFEYQPLRDALHACFFFHPFPSLPPPFANLPGKGKGKGPLLETRSPGYIAASVEVTSDSNWKWRIFRPG